MESCDDNDPGTINDFQNEQCECIGEPTQLSIEDPYECGEDIEGVVMKSDNLDIEQVTIVLTQILEDGSTQDPLVYEFIL